MSLTVINGLPAHVLFVHLVTVLMPLVALVLVVCAVWPKASQRMGLLLPALGLLALAMVPVTTEAGEWLEKHVDGDPLVRQHAELGDGLLPWAVGLFVLSVAVWWTTRRSAATEGRPSGTGWVASTPVRAAAVLLSLAVAAGSVVDVYRVGDSGAKAAWHDGFSKTALHHDDDEG